MKTYKFRGKDQFEFALDIIINRRLYYAPLPALNDPFEWNFDTYTENEPAWIEFSQRVLKYKICSLSLTYGEYLLWVHYASGFRGMAIEVDLPCKKIKRDDDFYKNLDISPAKELPSRLNDKCICSVNYSTDNFMQNSVFPHSDGKYYDADVIYRKAKKMEYEKEIRILTTTGDNYYSIPQDSSIKVIITDLMDKTQRDILTQVCKDRGIVIERLINDNNRLISKKCSD